MIVVDTSALMAIALHEAEAHRFEDVLFESARTAIGAPTVFEFRMVALGNRLRKPVIDPEELLQSLDVAVVAWTPEHAEWAFSAFAQFGKGRHPAKLNFGDCMSYALARSLDAPLLFKGDDFSKTDIRSAI